MATDVALRDSQQSLFLEEFFYFFLRLRKTRVRKLVQMMKGPSPGGDS